MNSAPVPAKTDNINLLNFDRKGLESFFVEMGEKTFRATQVLKWIHQAGISEISLMSNLSKSLRQQIEETCSIVAPEIVHEQIATDGTRKWVLQMSCGNRVETIFIPERGRGTLCVSSQVGCSLACPFCSTAQQGFNRNLSVQKSLASYMSPQKAIGGSG